MKFFFIIFLLSITLNDAKSIETKIIYNIENEIITNIDIKKEFKYLLAFNSSLKDLDKEQIFKISSDSIIREKIRLVELLKHYKKIKLNKEYANNQLKRIFSDLGLKSFNEFELYLKNYDLTLSEIEEKIAIEVFWNEFILAKYGSQIKVNEKAIRKKISKSSNRQSKEYNLAEIVFDINNKQEIKKKYNEIKKSIYQIGFENSASIYSSANSSKIGGKIGWISESSLNDKIKLSIKNLKIGEVSEPLSLSNSILILKILDIKISKVSINVEAELNKAINYEKSRQLDQYSKIYYNKVKKNFELNE